MVLIGVLGALVAAKAFALLVIVMLYLTASPVVAAFYTEMIVGFACKSASPRITFKQSLRQCDACGYSILLLMLHRYAFIGLDILTIGIFLRINARNTAQHHQHKHINHAHTLDVKEIVTIFVKILLNHGK